MKRIGLQLLCACILSVSLKAGLITTAPLGGTTTVFSGGSDSCISGASSGTDAGFGISADGDACYNYDGGFGLADNGFWDSGFQLIGINTSAATITIDLGGLFSSVGGFMNYAPGSATPIIRALAIDGITVLESYDLSVDAPISTSGTNNGAFRGISRGSADIAFLQISNSYMVMHDITLEGSSVPEPTSLMLMAGGLAGVALLRRRRRV